MHIGLLRHLPKAVLHALRVLTVTVRFDVSFVAISTRSAEAASK